MKETKVFGIGLQKTGTSTLGKVLTILGYKVQQDTDHDLVRALIDGKLEDLRKRAMEYDGFEDNPWPMVFKELDQWYPGSKFILTSRDENNWIQSICRHFGSNASEFREWYYGEGAPLGNEDRYLAKYREHDQAVRDYFKGRKNDFLIVDFEKGDGWKKICSFLAEDVPKADFPHLNKNKTLLDKLQHKIRGGQRKIKSLLGMK